MKWIMIVIISSLGITKNIAALLLIPILAFFHIYFKSIMSLLKDFVKH